MHRRGRVRVRSVPVGLALLAVGLALNGAVTPVRATPGFTFSRYAGTDRYDTARLIAADSFPSGAPTVIVASGQNFPDALAASYLAGDRGSPVLLTATEAPVPPPTLAALTALRAKNVILLGLSAAISPAVQNQLATTASASPAGGTLAVTRIGGATRYDTMLAVDETPLPGAGSLAGKKTAILASGARFPDALSVGPLSWANRFPTVLTDPTVLSPQAAQALRDMGVAQVLIAGGTAAVSDGVEQSVHALGISTFQRFAGTDRSDTSRLVAEFAISQLGFKSTHFNLASGDEASGGADALALGPHGGHEDPTPDLVTNTRLDPGKVVDFTQAHAATITSGHVAGGTAVLPDATLGGVSSGAGAATNQGFTVTPAVNATQAAGSSRQYSASGLGSAPVAVALFNCANAVFDSSNNVSFANSTAPGSANGNNAAPGNIGKDAVSVSSPVTPADGAISFSVTGGSDASSCVVPVVFSAADRNQVLELNANNQPTELFGVGGATQFSPSSSSTSTTAPGGATTTTTAAGSTTTTTTGSDQPPTLAITGGPTAGSTSTSAQPTFSGTAADSDGTVNTVQAATDGAPFTNNGVTGTTSWSYTPPGPLSEASHTICFRATDNASLTSPGTGPACRQFVVDLTPRITFAVVNLSPSSIDVSYSEPVNCGSGGGAQFTFSEAGNVGDGSDQSGSPTTISATGATTCRLTGFNGAFSTNDYGTLTYSPSSSGSQNVVDTDGGRAALAQTTVAQDTSLPTLSSIALGAASPTKLLNVRFSEPILCASVDTTGTTDFAVAVGGASNPATSVSCVGTTSPQVVLTLTNPIATGNSVNVTLQNGVDQDTVSDPSRNFDFVGDSVSGTV
ncbi:MAG: cell wall-binding repeat-containing protein [Acidimicrobiales bacterium]